MLYSIIGVILAVYVCITPFLYMKAVKFGIKMAENPHKASEEAVFTTQRAEKYQLSPQAEEELRKQRIEWENLEAFDGTGMNQKEVI
jgi:hypothetical protein